MKRWYDVSALLKYSKNVIELVYANGYKNVAILYGQVLW